MTVVRRPATWLVVAGSAAVAALALVSVLPVPSIIIWNRTESLPTGLYGRSGGALTYGAVVAFTPDKELQHWLSDRGYLPPGVPLLKTIRGMPGDEICRQDNHILINQTPVAEALRLDSQGRSLPVWEGCFELSPGDLFLLNDHPASLDGRYFGATPRQSVQGPYWHLRHLRLNFAPTRDAE